MPVVQCKNWAQIHLSRVLSLNTLTKITLDNAISRDKRKMERLDFTGWLYAVAVHKWNANIQSETWQTQDRRTCPWVYWLDTKTTGLMPVVQCKIWAQIHLYECIVAEYTHKDNFGQCHFTRQKKNGKTVFYWIIICCRSAQMKCKHSKQNLANTALLWKGENDKV